MLEERRRDLKPRAQEAINAERVTSPAHRTNKVDEEFLGLSSIVMTDKKCDSGTQGAMLVAGHGDASMILEMGRAKQVRTCVVEQPTAEKRKTWVFPQPPLFTQFSIIDNGNVPV